ncbi:chriz [Anopheles darlingi]|uniref:Chriz n=1 Tax=Anopheles darlingi TaxID=43151 RepID=W5JED3_ANODA|nr:chriz [Anopheles darlingi]
MGKDIDPADIGKHADLIKKAQADISSTDVLVCGRCNTVFHLLELFRAHKENEPNCRRSSTSIQDCDEAQAKVWAFLLWKSAQRSLATASEGDKPNHNNSWKLYQTWVKLDESVRDTWIVAGKTIQSFARIGSGNLQEMPVKITKTILETSTDAADKKLGTPGSVNRVAPQLRKPGEQLAGRPALSTLDPKRGTITGTPTKLDQTSPKTPVKRAVAKRTTPDTKVITEEEVEKILAKRFSPIIKMHEYLVKWSKRNNDENTWEPLTHLNSCQGMLEFFEKQLAKQKEQRAATAARTLQQQRQDKAKPAGAVGTATATTTPSTPTAVLPKGSPRSAKATAIDRVKLWTSGSRSPGDTDGTDGENKGVVKRKLNDSDADNNDSSQDGLGKRARTDVTEALSKVSQSSSVKIFPISTGKVTVNGGSGGAGTNADGTQKDGNAAEVVIKSPRDASIPSGITKKPGTVGTVTNLSPRGEAKVKIINRSEAAGTHGIFKISDSPTAQTATTASPVATTTSSAATLSPITRTVPISTNATPVSTTSGDVTTRFVRRNVDGTSQLFKQTIRKATKIVSTTPTTAAASGTATVQRPATNVGVRTITNNAGASVTATGVQKTTTVIGGAQTRTTLTPRAVSAGTAVSANRTGLTTVKSPPGVVRTGISAAATPSSEDKINALRKQGLNVVKRVGTPGAAASPAVSSAKKVPTKSATMKNEDEDEEMGDGFPGNLPLPAPPSPPRALTLCPVTGKVLSQAEGEPTPVPSPDEAEAADEKKEDESKVGEQQQLTEQQLEVDQMLANEDGSAFLVASEDGTLYRVAGKNADGQTILIPHGGNDGQSCLLMAAQEGEDEATNGGSSGVLTLNSAISEAVSMPQEEGQQIMEEQEAQMQIVGNQQLTIQTEDSQDGQITAEIVQAGAPSPGGTRRVVLMLPNGSLMMTEVTDEQYQSLNLTNPTEE